MPARPGRGAVSNREGRFASTARAPIDDGWDGGRDDEWQGELNALPPLDTRVTADNARSIISRNASPDIPFVQSINPYKGCEHGCIYCYARPSHSYLDLSPGLDFETRIYSKPDAPALLAAELRRPGYRCRPITIGANTDPYQPVEKHLGITRGLLEVLLDHRHPVALITKGLVVERDIDLLTELARHDLVRVHFSVTTLDDGLKRTLEPRAASGRARLRAMARLKDAGVPVGVMFAPVIPALNDHELEAVLKAAAAAGAESAGYILLRLPHEVRDLFVEWLQTHYPDRAEHVMSLVRQSRGGRDYDSGFGTRMRGTGVFAELLAARFALACRRFGMRQGRSEPLDTSQFRVPARAGDQLSLLG